jgi:hypothetical protein
VRDTSRLTAAALRTEPGDREFDPALTPYSSRAFLRRRLCYGSSRPWCDLCGGDSLLRRPAIGGEVIPRRQATCLQLIATLPFFAELAIDRELDDPSPRRKLMATIGETRLVLEERVFSEPPTRLITRGGSWTVDRHRWLLTITTDRRFSEEGDGTRIDVTIVKHDADGVGAAL